MFPVLVVAYVRLARREEREAAATFGADWLRYAGLTPAFFPHRTKPRPHPIADGHGEHSSGEGS